MADNTERARELEFTKADAHSVLENSDDMHTRALARDVLALAAELEAAGRKIDRLRADVALCRDLHEREMEAAEEQRERARLKLGRCEERCAAWAERAEAAEKRVAELEAVLERATATFDDFAMALPLLGHATMAAAARVASEATRMAAAASAEETPAENGGQDVWQADS